MSLLSLGADATTGKWISPGDPLMSYAQCVEQAKQAEASGVMQELPYSVLCKDAPGAPAVSDSVGPGLQCKWYETVETFKPDCPPYTLVACAETAQRCTVFTTGRLILAAAGVALWMILGRKS